jgi:hypothetical protein
MGVFGVLTSDGVNDSVYSVKCYGGVCNLGGEAGSVLGDNDVMLVSVMLHVTGVLGGKLLVAPAVVHVLFGGST